MFTSIPFRIRNGASVALRGVDLFPMVLKAAVAETRRVIAERQVLVAERLSGEANLPKRAHCRPTTSSGRQVAAEIEALEPLRQGALLGCVELAAVLPQLGRSRRSRGASTALLVGGRELLSGLGRRDGVLETE